MNQKPVLCAINDKYKDIKCGLFAQRDFYS